MDTITITIILLSLVVLAFVVSALVKNARRKAEERAARLKTDALSRGWSLETEKRGAFDVVRWRGMQDGVRWMAESLEGSSGGRRPRRITRTNWRTEGAFQPMSTVLLMGMPEGASVPKAQSLGDGFFASLAMKAVYLALDKGIDGFFGDDIGRQIDANDLKRVEDVENLLPGYAVMAETPAEATRLVSSGVASAARSVLDDPAWKGDRRPWILLWKDGVSIGRAEAAQSSAELEPVIRLGVAITRAIHRF